MRISTFQPFVLAVIKSVYYPCDIDLFLVRNFIVNLENND